MPPQALHLIIWLSRSYLSHTSFHKSSCLCPGRKNDKNFWFVLLLFGPNPILEEFLFGRTEQASTPTPLSGPPLSESCMSVFLFPLNFLMASFTLYFVESHSDLFQSHPNHIRIVGIFFWHFWTFSLLSPLSIVWANYCQESVSNLSILQSFSPSINCSAIFVLFPQQ